MNIPLYVILVGEPPPCPREGQPGARAPGLILDMVQAANGKKATPFAQSMAGFFSDNGVLLKEFVFRVEPQERPEEDRAHRHAHLHPSRPAVEAQFLSALILPLALFLALLLGILVPAVPGPGDVRCSSCR